MTGPALLMALRLGGPYCPAGPAPTALEAPRIHPPFLPLRSENGVLTSLIAEAVHRVPFELQRWAPSMAEPVSAWIQGLSPGAAPEAYFLQPDRFPFLHMPWWMETTLREEADPEFQSDLIYSSVNGYYFIRLVDNLMDGHDTVERSILPAAAFFHTQFHLGYQRYFPWGHPFWRTFGETWLDAHGAALHDAGLRVIRRGDFLAWSARKTGAAKIPLAAVGFRCGLPEAIPPWFEFCDVLGRCEQMTDDLFDWYADQGGSRASYFLSEARLRKRPAEPVAGWVAREGFAWGVESIQEWLVDLRSLATRLGSPEAERHVAERSQRLDGRHRDMAEGLDALGKVAGIFESV